MSEGYLELDSSISPVIELESILTADVYTAK
jgi:hypothetical protein